MVQPMVQPLVPEPIVLPRPDRAAVLRRGAAAVGGGARRLGPAMAPRLRRRPVDREHAAAQLRLLFDEMGGTFTKLGQLIACAESIVGPELANAFRTTLDQGPAVPYPQVRAAVEAELRRPIGEAFSSFDPAPMAAASIAVVHRAALPDGTPVAV